MTLTFDEFCWEDVMVPFSTPLSSAPFRYTSSVCAAALYTPVT